MEINLERPRPYHQDILPKIITFLDEWVHSSISPLDIWMIWWRTIKRNCRNEGCTYQCWNFNKQTLQVLHILQNEPELFQTFIRHFCSQHPFKDKPQNQHFKNLKLNHSQCQNERFIKNWVGILSHLPISLTKKLSSNTRELKKTYLGASIYTNLHT